MLCQPTRQGGLIILLRVTLVRTAHPTILPRNIDGPKPRRERVEREQPPTMSAVGRLHTGHTVRQTGPKEPEIRRLCCYSTFVCTLIVRFTKYT